jgi:hypothetical protein
MKQNQEILKAAVERLFHDQGVEIKYLDVPEGSHSVCMLAMKPAQGDFFSSVGLDGMDMAILRELGEICGDSTIIDDARHGIVLMIHAWSTLSDSDAKMMKLTATKAAIRKRTLAIEAHMASVRAINEELNDLSVLIGEI